MSATLITYVNPLCFGGYISRSRFFVNLVILRTVGAILGLALLLATTPFRSSLTNTEFGLLYVLMAAPVGVFIKVFEIGNARKRVRDIQGCENPHWLWTVGYLFPIVNIAIYLYLQFARSTDMRVPASSS